MSKRGPFTAYLWDEALRMNSRQTAKFPCISHAERWAIESEGRASRCHVYDARGYFIGVFAMMRDGGWQWLRN